LKLIIAIKQKLADLAHLLLSSFCLFLWQSHDWFSVWKWPKPRIDLFIFW